MAIYCLKVAVWLKGDSCPMTYMYTCTTDSNRLKVFELWFHRKCRSLQTNTVDMVSYFGYADATVSDVFKIRMNE